MTESFRPLRTLFLGAPNMVSMGILRGWSLAGHSICELWYPLALKNGLDFRRDRKLAKSAPGLSMHGMEERQGLKVRPVTKLQNWSSLQKQIDRLKPDIILCAMFLDKLPKALLDQFPDRAFNLHPSLLPAYRGATPLFSMMWDRNIERYSGVSLHLVNESFDRGAILAQQPIEFPSDGNLATYNALLIKAAAEAAIQSIPKFINGEIEAVEQEEGDFPESYPFSHKHYVSTDMSCDDALWRINRLGDQMLLRVEVLADNLFIVPPAENLGPPTGALPIKSDRLFEGDFVDGRLRFSLKKLERR